MKSPSTPKGQTPDSDVRSAPGIRAITPQRHQTLQTGKAARPPHTEVLHLVKPILVTIAATLWVAMRPRTMLLLESVDPSVAPLTRICGSITEVWGPVLMLSVIGVLVIRFLTTETHWHRFLFATLSGAPLVAVSTSIEPRAVDLFVWGAGCVLGAAAVLTLWPFRSALRQPLVPNDD